MAPRGFECQLAARARVPAQEAQAGGVRVRSPALGEAEAEAGGGRVPRVEGGGGGGEGAGGGGEGRKEEIERGIYIGGGCGSVSMPVGVGPPGALGAERLGERDL